MWLFVAGLLLASSLTFEAFAQGGAEILGTVRDTSGAVVPGATVEITSDQQGWARNTLSSDQGSYEFSSVPVGSYTVQVEKSGFKGYKQVGVIVQVDLHARVDVGLEIGTEMQTVTVTGSAALLETTSSTQQNVIDRERIQNLPLNGRDTRQLISLVPGGVTKAPLDQFIASPSFSVNGAREDQVNFRLDGGEHMDTWFGSGLPYPNPDALQEFTVQTSNFSAKFGRNAGAIVDAVTRSGSNSLHGTLFEFFRNNALDARPYFSAAVPIFRRNQFGATVGGPVVFPHYNGRDKTFWFFSWQTTRQFGSPAVNTYTTLSPEQRQGILTSSKPIINPQTGAPFPTNSNGQYVIPQPQLSVPIQNFLEKYLPLPTDSSNLLTFPAGGSNDENQFIFRIDERLGAKDTMSYRYFYDNPTGVVTYGAGIGPGLNWFDNSKVVIHSNTLQETHIFSPALVNYANFTLGNERHLLTPNTMFTWRDLGAGFLPADNSSSPDNNISVAGLFSTYSGFNWRNGRNNPDVSDELTIAHGEHTVVIGADFQYTEIWNRTPFGIDGTLSFNGQVTGSSIADFLLGDMNTFTQQSTNAEDLRQSRLAVYVQDDYKVAPTFTLNLGLRYEPYFPYFETKGREGFWAPGQQSTRFPNATPGLLFAFDNNSVIPNKNTIINKDWKNFAPRVGFAWDPGGTEKWSVRGGYGVFYNGLSVGIRTIRGIYNQPFTRVFTVFSTNIANPYAVAPFNGNAPFPYSAPTTPEEEKTVTFSPGANVVGWDRNFATPYTQSYNLSVQRMLGQNWLVQAAYVGSKATKQFDSHNINPAIYVPGTGANGQPLSTTTNTQARRVFPTIGNLEIESTAAYSNYNSLQMVVDKRMSRGLTIMGSYVYSKVLGLNVPLGEGGGGTRNPFMPNLDYGIMPEDITHRVISSFLYQFPRLASDGRALGLVTNGWGTEGIVNWQSGVPFTVRSGTDNSRSGVGLDTADQVGHAYLSSDRPLPDKLAKWFNTTSFQSNAIGTFGSTGINTLRGPRLTNIDLALTKSTHVFRDQSVLFRAEFFNMLNHPNFGNPNSNLSSGVQFGRITTNVGTPRNIEFSLRYSF